ncbi:GntR family transcriptional regulator [Glutamicibacter sp. NPDC087344]|uniref:GntR family transcriptional regulator n=1 Tax=Glutamicibacter sp. NPDC087344 TaxID=3363994 RepID=UPI003813055A
MSQEQRENENERVLQGIRLRILDREFSVGEKLRERALADEFRVSRSPVRYAIQQLVIEGLVAREAGNEAVVVGMRKEDRVDLDELMVTLDLLACRQAIVRYDERKLSEVKTFVERFCATDGLATQTEVNEFIYRLRSLVVESSGNSILLEINDVLNDYYFKWNPDGVSMDELSLLFREFADHLLSRDFNGVEAVYRTFAIKAQAKGRAEAMEFLRSPQFPSSETVQSMVFQRNRASQPLPKGEASYQSGGFSIAQRVREEIYSGSRRAGDALSARTLAEDFKVSRTPAQQAIDELIADRLVSDAGPRRSARIRDLAESEINDVIDVALALDCYATKLAGQRRDGQDLSALKQYLADQVASVEGKANASSLVPALMNFRKALLVASKNRYILSANKVIEARLQWHLSKLEKHGLLVRGNYLLLESIINRDELMGRSVFECFFDLALNDDYVNLSSGFAVEYQ